MDEALLTGRFSVEPNMTRRGMSAKGSRESSARAGNMQEEKYALSREGSARSRSISRSSSRADTCLRRSRSAFDMELFRSHLRLNKSLSRNRFKEELLDIALCPIDVRAGSAHAETEESELTVMDGNAPERLQTDIVSQVEKIDMDELLENDYVPAEPEKVSATDLYGDTIHGHDDEENDQHFHSHEKLDPETTADGFVDTTSVVAAAKRGHSGRLSGDPFRNLSPTKKDDSKRIQRKRTESRLHVLVTHGAGPRKDRLDGAIVINPQRNKIRYDITSELISPRRFTPPNRTSMSSDSLMWSCTSSSEDEELEGLIGHTPECQGGKRKKGGDGAASTLGNGEKLFRVHASDSEQYDTDLEVEEGSEFKSKERNQSASCLDTDFGHLTYEAACVKFSVVPRQRVIHQLTTTRLQLNFCGLNKLEAQALALGLLNNTRLEELDLASNGMDGPSVACIADCFQRNIYITKLNLGGNSLEQEGAESVGNMLKLNTWVTHLNLSDCGITDHEIGFLAKGIQENSTVMCLNLSKNKLEIHGGRHLGAALAHNNSVECLNLSWNMLRGGGAVAVGNSLQKNRTVRELNLAWNGLGFQGSLAISEALKVNRTMTKLDISHNRVDWDCAPYLAKALSYNRSLEMLELGCNPISMEGCMKLLEAIDRPSSRVSFLSLMEIPISNKIAFKATEISKKRDFSMEHGGVITTGDAFGVKRVKREDPLTLLIRYLSTMGIRVVDLFRMFDTTSKLFVSQANFIRGLKRVRVPLDEEDMLRVARRMRSDKRGDISYQELAANVRGHIREERLEDRRLQRLEHKKREERRRILQSDVPLYAPPSVSYLPALYNMYGSTIGRQTADTFSSATPKQGRVDSIISHRGSDFNFYQGKTPSGGFLPRIDTPGRYNRSPFRRDLDTPARRYRGIDVSRGSPMTLVRHGTQGIPGTRRPLYPLNADMVPQDKAVNTSAKMSYTGASGLDPRVKELGYKRKNLIDVKNGKSESSPKEVDHSSSKSQDRVPEALNDSDQKERRHSQKGSDHIKERLKESGLKESGHSRKSLDHIPKEPDHSRKSLDHTSKGQSDSVPTKGEHGRKKLDHIPKTRGDSGPSEQVHTRKSLDQVPKRLPDIAVSNVVVASSVRKEKSGSDKSKPQDRSQRGVSPEKARGAHDRKDGSHHQ